MGIRDNYWNMIVDMRIYIYDEVEIFYHIFFIFLFRI